MTEETIMVGRDGRGMFDALLVAVEARREGELGEYERAFQKAWASLAPDDGRVLTVGMCDSR